MIDRTSHRGRGVGVLAVGAAVAFPATAVADDPAARSASPVPGGSRATAAARVRRCRGWAAGPDRARRAGAERAGRGTRARSVRRRSSASTRTTVLGQNPVPSAPGGGPGAVPNLNVFNNAYGVQQ